MVKILERTPIKQIIAISKKIVLPGFDKLSLYEVSSFFFHGLWWGSIPSRASSIAFNFFLALFPAIIFLFTLIPYIPIDNFQAELFELLQDVFPPNAYDSAKSTIDDVIKNGRSGLLSFGFLLAIFFSTNGISTMISEFNHSVHTVENRSYFYQRYVALVLTLILSTLLITAIILIVFSENFSMYLVDVGRISKTTAEWIGLSRWAILIALLFVGISFLYYYAPSKKTRFRFFSAGSTMATILVVLTSVGFSYYVAHFARYNKLYGSIGTLIVILLWIYFNSISLLLGFELNASITNAQRKRQKRLMKLKNELEQKKDEKS